MSPEETIWYRIGRAHERARLARRTDERGGRGAVRGPEGEDTRAKSGKAVAKRDRRPEHRDDDGLPVPWPDADDLLGAAVWLLLDRVIGRIGGRRRPGVLGLVRAGVAGAAAALLSDLTRPLLVPDAEPVAFGRDTIDRMLAGLAQGLVYGALVEPRVPGPALLKGALYGSVEFLTHPAGGLSALLAPHTPQGRLPVVEALVGGRGPHDRAYLEQVVFGIALALLYESSPSSNGTLRALDDE